MHENDKQRFSLKAIPSSSSLPSSPPPPPSEDDPSQHLIRANQGHSLPIVSSNLLTPIARADADFPAQVVHGTFPHLWPRILASGGLSRMQRTHVHFARGLPDAPATLSKEVADMVADAEAEGQQGTVAGGGEKQAEKVLSGMRRDASVLVWVDVGRSMDVGRLKWWRSENGVVLTEGDDRGLVRLEFVTRAVQRATGQVIWEPTPGQAGERA